MSSDLAQGIKLGRMPYGVLGEVSQLSFDGETVRMGGRIEPVTEDTDADRIALLAVRREQLLGLASPWDSPTQPLIVAGDPSITGYYADLAVSTDIDHMGAGHFTWSLAGRRLLGRDAPGHEILQVGGLRSNSHSIVAADALPWVAVPAACTEFYSGVSSTFTGTRVTDTGDVGFRTHATGFNRRISYMVLEPARYWDGAAVIELGADHHPVTGRQVWDSDASSNGWRIGNGLVRVSQSATAGELLVESVNGAGTTWASENYSLKYDSAGKTIDTMTTFTVLCNTPEVCTVRVGLRSGTHRHRHLLDITVRRGDTLAEFMWRTDEALLGRVSHDPTEAASDVTDGGATVVGITENTGATEPWIILQAAAATESNANGWISRTTQGTSYAFAIGTSDATYSASDVRKYYFGVNECWQSLVGR